MMKPYNRDVAVTYADQWALKRNPRYYDFNNIGGDCTNYCSQAIFAGTGKMNYHPSNGWYYIDGNNKSPSWTGVNFFYQFLVNNNSAGPVAREVRMHEIQIGDIIQVSFVQENMFNHSLVVVETGKIPNETNIKVDTHTDDQYHNSLTDYQWTKIRFLHVEGYN